MPTLFHYSTFQGLWEALGLFQVGPCIPASDEEKSVSWSEHFVDISEVRRLSVSVDNVLIHYTDPFLLRARPLIGLRHWLGPRLLVCGDLHHGLDPIGTLSDYLALQPHDAVLLTFNPALLAAVQERLRIPVRSLPPTFFRYPVAQPVPHPLLELLHVGSLGPHHPRRRELVAAMHVRGRVPFRHASTTSAEEAAALYAQHALVLNVPLNHDLNHRFFEVMAAGVPQVVFGDPGLVGEHRHLAERPDVFWASSLDELEALVLRLFAEPARLRAIPVAPPPYWELKDLLKAAFAP
jgi:hypothetical protein